jgi:hypothetical protein
MPAPVGFTYTSGADGSVTIRHHGRTATTLRGARASTFLAEVETSDAQLTMARWTGSYRRGNERTARLHPRNAEGR